MKRPRSTFKSRVPSRGRSSENFEGRTAAKASGGRRGKDVLRVSDLISRGGRWVMGLHSCAEVLRVRPQKVSAAVLRSDWIQSEALRPLGERLQSLRASIETRSLEQLNFLGSGHQGIALNVNESPELDWEGLTTPGSKILLMLDGIEDPHNLGAILRTAWLSGVQGILIPEDRAVGLTPTVCKIASGGAEHVPVEAHVNFGPVLERLKKMGFWIYGLAERGRSLPWQVRLAEKVVWVLGSEGRGLRVATERACDELIRLPQVSSGSSYNASIAASMALMETCRQFGKPE